MEREVEVELTVVDPGGSGLPLDLAVRAPAGTRVAQLRAPVVAACGAPPDARLVLGTGEPLSEDAELGAPPLVRGAVLAVAPAPVVSRAAWSRPPALLALHVAAGPDAGGVLPLAPGDHVLGRAGRADLRLADPRLSREHADLRVDAAGVHVRDRTSTNGTVLDGGPLGTTWTLLSLGSRLELGSTVVVLRRPEGARLPVSVRGDGRLAVHPRCPPVAESLPVELVLPNQPAAAPPPRWQVLAILLPLGLAVVMAVLWSPMALLFGLTAPVLAVGTTAGERRGHRRRATAALDEHRARSAEVRARAAAALAADDAALQERFPDASSTLTTACGPGPRLWERDADHPDVLAVRLGSGDVPSAVTVTGDGPASPSPERLQHDLAPVVARLLEVGVLGIAGPRAAARGLVRSVVGQAAVRHGPSSLRVRILTPRPDEWAWVRWLPHAPGGPDTEVDALVRDLGRVLDTVPGPSPAVRGGPRVLLVVDGAAEYRDSSGLRRLLREGPSAGVVVVWTVEHPEELPAECRATAQVLAPGSRGLRWSSGAQVLDAVPALVSAGWSDRLARALAPLTEVAGTDGELPGSVRLLDLLSAQGLDATDPVALARAWAERPRSTRVVLGVTAGGPWQVELRRDGPHLLVAGTTGAGKSELLTALVTSLAVVNRPDELSLLLVDYKGGAAFTEVAHLPHVVGLVTDLDPHLTARALTSLHAEVRRRERVLSGCGCRDVEALEQLRDVDPTAPVLPRLVVVVDELRVLAEELPEFLDGLVRLAAVGRSLGLHLVLATQRPAGVVSADVRANTNLRIALRVRDPAESSDVVDAPDAAALTADRPGRALTRTGGGPLVAVQAAWVSGPAPEASPDGGGVRVRLACDVPAPVPASGPTDAARVLAAVRAASAGIPPAVRPWLDPLPDHLRRADLLGPGLARPAAGGAPSSLVLGWVDEPHRQRRTPLTWALREPLLVVGGPRSGRTTTVRSIAAAAAGESPELLHLYVVAGSGEGLDALAHLPHTGAVTSWRSPERVLRVLRHLDATITERQQSPTPAPVPEVVLLVDDASRWLDDAGPDAPAEVDTALTLLHRVLTEGPAVRVLSVLTGDRRLLTSRWGSASGERLLLAMADPTDFLLAGVPARDVPGRMPPGRALRRTPDGVCTAQVAVVGSSAEDDEAAFDALVTASTRRWASSTASRLPAVLPPLPVRLSAADLDEALVRCGGVVGVGGVAGQEPPGALLLLGVGGASAGPVGLDLAQTPAALIAGPPGSGRSSALLAVGQRLRACGSEVVVVAARRSALTTWAGQLGLPVSSPSSTAPGLLDLLQRARHEGRPVAVLVDDAELLGPGAVNDALEQHLEGLHDRDRGSALVLAGDAVALAASYRGLVPLVRRTRTGVLLHPLVPAGGELLGVRTPRVSAGPPGRATLVVQGRASMVQLALPWPISPP